MGYCVKDARVKRVLTHIVDHRGSEREGERESKGERPAMRRDKRDQAGER